MKQIIKKYVASSAKSLGLVAVGIALAAGTVALAYTAPTSVAPGGNVPAPVNTGTFAQTKSGDLTVGLLGSNTKLISNSWLLGSYAIFKNIAASARGAFTNMPDVSALNALSKTDYLQAGEIDASTASITKGLSVDKYGKTLVIGDDDLSTVAPMVKVENTGPNTKFMNLFQVKSNQGGLSVFSRGSALSSFADKNVSVTQVNGNLSVDKELYLHGGNPGVSKVLMSRDAQGTAAWGQIQTTTSPGGLIKYVSVTDNAGSAEVSCPSGTTLIGGGGSCTYGVRSSRPIQNANPNNFTGTKTSADVDTWRVECLENVPFVVPLKPTINISTNSGVMNSTATAQAICMDERSIATGVEVTSAAGTGNPGGTGGTGGSGGTGGGTPSPAWYAASGSGNKGESCDAWIARTQGAVSYTGVDVQPWGFLNLQHTGTGKTYCAYSYATQQTIPSGSSIPGQSSCYFYSSGTVIADATPVAACTDLNAFPPRGNGAAAIDPFRATTWFYK